ncbi:translation initiation factor eIF3 subunit g [Tulasnella sp. 425]|nr:translation initiation factor eIF3 subunit g [Tulasnella sp. 425]
MVATNGSTVKTSWADDVEDFGQNLADTPRVEDSTGPDGIRTVIEYTTNEEGKKVKASLHPTSILLITRKIKRTLTKSTVDPVVAARKSWAKFGADRGKPVGPDRATTTLGENTEPAAEAESDLKKQLENKKIMCRLCKGAHFTSKCPYRDTLGALGMDGADTPLDDGAATPKNEPVISAPAPTGGKYVPPWQRPGAPGRGAGESMNRPANRDDMPTLRVTNVSLETEENDLRDLFSRFGRVQRAYIGRDRDTGIPKGYAFVSFENKADAERAMQKTNGMGYDNLILSVSWSQPREQR